MEKEVKVGQTIYYWVWTSINEGDVFHGSVTEVHENHVMVKENETGSIVCVRKSSIHGYGE